MKFLRWVVAILAGLAVIAFAVANRMPAEVSFDPLPFRFELPLFAVAFGALIIGFVAGAVVAWASANKWRKLARTRKRRVDVLERELARLQEPGGDAGDRAARLPKAQAG
ncbi:MAG: lipopolysaccharide assembly LapA domain-containing protein [Alphaproteobacteria bacterium]